MIKIIEDNLGMAWYEEYCEASPVFISLAAHSLSEGILSLKYQYKCVINFYFDKKTSWNTLVDDQDKITDEIMQNYKKDKTYYKNWFLKWKKKSLEYNLLFDEIKRTNLSLLSEQELFALHNKAWSMILECRKISMITDPFAFGSERFMEKELKEFCKKNDENNFSGLYSALVTSEKESFMNEFELELISIAKRIKNDMQLYGLLKKPEKLLNLSFVKKHLDKYCWIKCNWGRAYRYDINHLINEIKELLTQNMDELDRIKKETSQKNIKLRRKTIKQYNFQGAIKVLSELAGFFIYWHDLRKVNALKFIYYESLFLEELSKRFNLNYDDFLLFDITEIKQFAKTRAEFMREAEKRKELFAILHTNKNVDIIYGNKAKYYSDKITKNEKIKHLDKISGIAACAGYAKGKVRIIHESRGFDSFKENEILVTGMTRPEYAVLMKKAAAIVTDDGGVACHAAIISRELKKPCIVGTRIATKVLKDGDMVEVDADNSIVKII